MNRSIVLAASVHALPDRVFEILTTTEGQRAFWTEDCDVHDDSARFGFAEAPVDLEVSVRREPNSLVQMNVISGFPYWDGSTWEWELSEGDDSHDSTTIIFRHYGFGDGIDDAGVGGTAQTWAMILDRLTKFIATGIVQPFFMASEAS